MIKLIKKTKVLKKYKDLLRELILRDIKLKYRRSVLGIFWSFLDPLFTMIILTMVFSTFFRRDIENFPVYILTGRLLYSFFSVSTRSAMKSIRSNAALIKKVYVPKYIYPLSTVLSTFITFLISLIVLVLVMIVTRIPITINIIYFPIPIFYLLILTIGSGFLLSALSVFFRDIEHLYTVVLLLIMYTTAIFYPADIVPEQYQFILNINPLFHIVSTLREIVLHGNAPSLILHIKSLGSSLIVFILGIVVFYKTQDKFILFI